VAAGRTRRARSRRVSLPGVHELFRPIGPGPASDSGRQASGREAHPQKITVYLSVDELIDLERARLTLRGRGISVDRGRLVREAIALLLADLESGGDASVTARRLQAAIMAVNGSVPADDVVAVNGSVPADDVVAVNGSVPADDVVAVNGRAAVAAAVQLTGAVPAAGLPAEPQ
jgi:hypothetical protein